MKALKCKTALLAAIMATGFAVDAQAGITYNMGQVLPGQSITPSGSAPWLTATFSNTNTAGQVQLTLQASLSGSDFIDGSNGLGWGFNLYSLLDPNNLLITATSGGTNQTADILQGLENSCKTTNHQDCYTGDGNGGLYDFGFAWKKDNKTGANTFDGAESAIYLITYTASLPSGYTFNENSFDFKSTPQSAAGGSYGSIAHVQDIGTGGSSTWIIPGSPILSQVLVPEPSVLTLFGVGLFGLAFYNRRKLKK